MFMDGTDKRSLAAFFICITDDVCALLYIKRTLYINNNDLLIRGRKGAGNVAQWYKHPVDVQSEIDLLQSTTLTMCFLIKMC